MSESIWSLILEKIRKVPTPENTQAWSFRCNSEELGIYWQPDKGKHCFDVNNHAACLSLGCLLEYIDTAAASLEFKVKLLSFDHQAFGGLGPVATLSLQSMPLGPSNLEPVLSIRSTNRGAFKKHDLPKMLERDIELLAQEFPNLQVCIEKNLSPQFTQNLCKLEAAFYAYPEYLQDLLKNIIFSSKQRHLLKTGIYHEELSLFILEKLPLYLAKKFPIVQKILPYLGINFFVRLHNKRLLKSSHLLILGTTRPSHKSLIEIGRAGVKAWLMLNKNGFAVHPMTALALQIYELNTDLLPVYFSKKHRSLLMAVSKGYAEELKIPYPVWVLRFGQPLSLPRPETGLSLRNELKLES